MKFIFRTDASIKIGAGHVMRCLTLAKFLRSKGHHCEFICRDLIGNLSLRISKAGFFCHLLIENHEQSYDQNELSGGYYDWLVASVTLDASQTIEIVKKDKIDWLIVDHYSLDDHWETQIKQYVDQIIVIDDLANRRHNCDILLDQTLNRDALAYDGLVTQNVKLLCGSNYVLLRPDFFELREASLLRRKIPIFKNLLVSLGGMDENNVTGTVLEILADSSLPQDLKITILLEETAPWLSSVNNLASSLPWDIKVLSSVDNVAELMMEADLAIGAGGTSCWERCSLGLPTILLVLAENQQEIARQLLYYGAVFSIDDIKNLDISLTEILSQIIEKPSLLADMSKSASSIIVQNGLCALINELKEDLNG
tara:strand:+ start:220 stop:1323 length:1104 start_codon:yes stop_codon:yes gene_type:complete